MNDKNKDIILVVVLILFVGFIGYFVGSKSSDDGSYYEESSLSEEQSSGQSSSGESSSPAASQQLDLSETLQKHLQVLKENPSDAATLAKVGDLYFSMRQFDIAIGYYNRAVKINTQDVDSYNDMALASFYLNDFTGALKHIDSGVRINPSYQRIWLTKGFIHSMGQGDKEKAIEAWTKCVAIDPDSQVGKAANDYLVKYKNEEGMVGTN